MQDLHNIKTTFIPDLNILVNLLYRLKKEDSEYNIKY